jgi:hypothetical protein
MMVKPSLVGIHSIQREGKWLKRQQEQQARTHKIQTSVLGFGELNVFGERERAKETAEALKEEEKEEGTKEK